MHWKNASTLDDTLDVFPCHGVGGMVGMLMTGIFAKDVGLMSGHAYTFLVHLRRAGVRGRVLVRRLFILYKVTDLIIPLRVTEEQEAIGLDLSQHGEVMQDPAGAQVMLAKSAWQPRHPRTPVALRSNTICPRTGPTKRFAALAISSSI